MGIGSVWIGLHPIPIIIKPVRKLLDIPDCVIPLGAVCLGYPNEIKEPRTQYNDNVVYWQKYEYELLSVKMSLLSVKTLFFICYSIIIFRFAKALANILVKRCVVLWRIVGAGWRMQASLPRMPRAMCGHSRFALLLNREPIHRMDYGSAGTADVPTFIWTSPARLMWACAAGR